MSIYVATTYEQAEILANTLLSYQPVVLGFDTETTIGREESPHHASIVQFSTDTTCYIFQIYRIFKETQKLPRDLVKILQNPNIIKVCVDITSDIIQLASYGINLRGSIDIQCIARTMDISDLSMEALANRFILGYSRKGKLELGWNWDENLLNEQITYAALDAYLSINIYKGMLNGVNIVTKIPEENPQKEEEDYLQWLNKMICHSSFKFDKVVNQTVNSYGPWRKKYSQAERTVLAEKLLAKFIKEGRF